MSKLIDYNGLSTFQTNLLNDNATSELATWSSEKINNMLAALEARIAALENPTTVE